MARDDLLALTDDDLAALSNRGNVKRAQRELDEGTPTVELEETGGNVSARWSDGVECRIAAGASPAEARCTCRATTFCRHLVRTVLAYRRAVATEAAPAVAQGPWDPGAIDDERLAAAYRKQALAKARKRFEQGMLVELVRSAKPTAHFDEEGATVRFLVSGDPRYTHCDCEEPAPCRHVAMAVWAFRRLAPERAAGMISTHTEPLPIPAPLLDDVEKTLQRLGEEGFSGTPAVGRDPLRRLESRARDGGLIWIADLLAELAQSHERYAKHDARFAPFRVAELLGELLIRCDAVRSNTDAVPQLLIRGNRHDRLTAMGQSRMIGLGCGVRVLRRAVEVNAYLQDADTGTVVVVGREFADLEADAEPRPFGRLGQTHLVKGTSLAALGAGQLLIQGGRRAANRRFLPGRARAVVHPQNFAWEKLRAPVLAEDFGEVQARLASAPPASLRARRLTEDFHVCPVAAVESAGFDAVDQAVEAALGDGSRNRAMLWHPYSARGKEGAEATLAALGARGDSLRFVAGRVRLRGSELVIHPTCLVFDDGPARTALQPWVASSPSEIASTSAALPGSVDLAADPIGDYPRQLLEAVGELVVGGLRSVDAATVSRWREIARSAEALGLTRLADHVGGLAGSLEAKLSTPRWQARAACASLLRVSALARLAVDLA